MDDFNEITSSFEKRGESGSQRQMEAFREVLKGCDLRDLNYECRWYTWERGRFHSTNVRERIDRVVANS